MRATSLPLSLLLLSPLGALAQTAVASVPTTLPSLVSQYSLTTSYAFPAPTATLRSNASASFIRKNWNLNRNSFQAGADEVAFVADPYDSSNSAPVLAVNYDAGSFGGSGAGGAQFYAQPLNSSGTTSNLASMLLTYDIAFESGYQFNLGGKLPGLRGGPSALGCSGGSEADGSSCFSTRLMWRSSGAGEVYAYIPTKNICPSTASNVICNSDYGTSLSRGSFTFSSSQWSTVSLFVQLNSPPSTANGRILLFLNGVLALSHTNLQLRSADSITSVGGLFFSTFFGGSDSSWSSPRDQRTFFRNFKLQGGSAVSDGQGATVSGSATSGATSSPRLGPTSLLQGLVAGGVVLASSLLLATGA